VLGLECSQCGLDELLCDAAACQVMPNERVAGPALREQLGATAGEPSVVEDADTGEARERFVACGRSDARALQALKQLALREIPARQGLRGPAHRLVAAQLSVESAGSFAAELRSYDQACGQDHLRRQGAPALAVELDFDL
jgi:hypothetical protein